MMSQLLAELDMQLNLPEYCTLKMRKNVRLQLVAKLVLGVGSLQGSYKDHYAVKAFVNGFDQRLSLRYGTTLLNMRLLDLNSKQLLLSLHAQFPQSGESVKPYLDWIHSGVAIMCENEERFKSNFFRYLSGAGHIDNCTLNRQISEDEVKEKKADTGLRMAFQAVATTESQKNSQMKTPPPIEVHTCYSQAIIPLHEYLLELLVGLEEDATWFEVYLHSTFVDNSFNTV
ncbi:hypothetical protein PM082_022696 [Marasmius tenuissimus]|nr:hypothetical protein PM082_022696 [Marasmius tenuissimus]